MRRFYNAYCIIFLGLGLLYPVNILIGFYDSRFIKYGVFYLSLVVSIVALLMFRKVNRAHLTIAFFQTLCLGFFILIDVVLFRFYADPYDAIRLMAILVSWFLICVGVFSYASAIPGNVEHRFKAILTPYFFLNILMLVTVYIGLIMIIVTGINVDEFAISSKFGYEFYGRLERDSDNMFRGFDEFLSPYGLTLFAISPRIITVDGVPIVLNGWAYEPHLFAFFFAPSIFVAHLFLRSKFSRWAFYAASSFAMFGASSATFWVSFAAVGFVFLLRSIPRLRISEVNRYLLAFFVILCSSFPILFIFGDVIGDLINNFVVFFENKVINPTGHSRDSTVGYWQIILSPATVFGLGPAFVPAIFEIAGKDLGLLTTLAILSIFLVSFMVIGQLLSSKDTTANVFAYSLLYVTIHALKFPLMFFTYPVWIFWISAGVWLCFVQKETLRD